MSDPVNKLPDVAEPAANVSTVAAGVTKSGIAWLGVILGKSTYDWADIAAFAAAIYTGLLIIGWLWDRLLVPVVAPYFPPARKRRSNGRSTPR